jgi:hypothetical protein
VPNALRDNCIVEAGRDEVLDDLEELARTAQEKTANRRYYFGRYSQIRDVLWVSAAVLAGAAGALAIADVPKTLTATAAFGSALAAALEAKFTPAERRLVHLRAAADYEDIAWRARQAAKRGMKTSELVEVLMGLHEEKHHLDREFGPDTAASRARKERHAES